MKTYFCSNLPHPLIKTNKQVFEMKSYKKELIFEVPTRRGFVNITSEVESSIRESGVKEGLVLVNTKQS